MIYNICQMLTRDNSNFSYSFPVTLDDGTESILFTSDEFKTIIMNQYTSFGLYSPSYYDSDQKQMVAIIEDTDAAIEELHKLFTLWIKDRKSGISKMLDALRKSYNPIWNVDGVEGTIHQETHTGTDTNNKTGFVKNTGSSSTTSTGKSTTTDKGSSSNTKTGNETNEPTGSDVVTKAVTTYDDNTFRDTEKTTTDFKDRRKDTHTYNSVKDTYEVDSQNPIKSEYEVDGQNPLKETYLVDDENPLKETYNTEDKKTLNLKDEVLNMEIRQGNIGVTSTQSLIRQQIDLTELDDIITYAIHDFVHRYLIILS